MIGEKNKPIAEWVTIPGFEDCYVINRDGIVKNLERSVDGHNGNKIKKEKVCKQFLRNGYLSVSLSKNNKVKHLTIHRLLGMLFIPNPENKATINHINGVKTDNRLENLEWATSSEQIKHAFNSGLFKPHQPMLGKTGFSHNRSKAVYQLDMDGNILNEFGSALQAAKSTNSTQTGISKCCRGEMLTHNNYKWKFSSNGTTLTTP